MSDITTNPIANEDNVRKHYEPPETPDDDNMNMTRSKCSSLVAQALKEQIIIDNKASTEAVKLAYAEGLKHGSQKQSYPLQSSSLETKNIRLNQNSVTANGDNRLK